MAYTLTKAQLISLKQDIVSPLYTYDLLLEKGYFAFGELLNLRLEITSAANFSAGQQFLFNPCFFAPAPYQVQYPFGKGWVVLYAAAPSSFAISFVLNNPAAETTERNYTLTATKVSAKKIQLDLVFYAGQDLFQYINGAGQSNAQRLQFPAIGQGLLEANQPNVYSSQLSYLECILYEAGANLLPVPSAPATDPYVRSPLDPSQKQCSFEVLGRFVDNEVLAAQAYAGAPPALLYNALQSVVVDTPILAKITDASRRTYPTLNSFNDTNFEFVLNGGEASDKLMLNKQNTVKMGVKIPYSTPTKVVAMLMRVDAATFANAQFFPLEYELERTEIVNNATPYPSYLTTTISAPTSIVTGAGLTTVTFQLDGSKLVQGGVYRLWLGLYNVAGRYASSHISPPLRAVLQAPPSLTISGANLSYNNAFTGNDTVMTTLARHKSGVVLDSSTYTGLSFTGELKGVKFSAFYDGALLENGRYNFTSGSGAGTPEMTLEVAGADYFFSYISRLPYNGGLGNKTLEIVWSIDFEYQDVFGALQRTTYQYKQFIRVRPLNSTRLVSMTLLDYTDFQASIITPIRSLCDDNPFVVIQVEKNGAPDANQLALAIIGGAQNTTNPPTIYEEEAYVSPVGLPQLDTPLLSQVETTFGDDFAYFILDTRLLPSSNLFNAVGAIIYNI